MPNLPTTEFKPFGTQLSESSRYNRQIPAGSVSGSMLQLHSGMKLHEIRFMPSKRGKYELMRSSNTIWMGLIRQGSTSVQLPDLGIKTIREHHWFIGRFEEVRLLLAPDQPVHIMILETDTRLMKHLLALAEPGIKSDLACFTCNHQFQPTAFSGPSTASLQMLSQQIHTHSTDTLQQRLCLEEASLDWISELFRQPNLLEPDAAIHNCALKNQARFPPP